MPCPECGNGLDVGIFIENNGGEMVLNALRCKPCQVIYDEDELDDPREGAKEGS